MENQRTKKEEIRKFGYKNQNHVSHLFSLNPISNKHIAIQSKTSKLMEFYVGIKRAAIQVNSVRFWANLNSTEPKQSQPQLHSTH